MFDRGRNTLGLKTVNIRGGDVSVHMRVFGERLETASTERGALSVHSRSQEYVTPCKQDQGLHRRELREWHKPLARHSSASAVPISRARSTSKEEPRPVEAGKQFEGTPLKTDELDVSCGTSMVVEDGVHRVPRTPLGPSLMRIEGTPASGMGSVCHQPCAV